MYDESESKSKVICSVWTALENFVNKRSVTKIWEQTDIIQPKSTTIKTKVKFKIKAVLTTFVNECAMRQTSRSPLVNLRPKSTEIANMQIQRNTNAKQHRYSKLLEIHEKEIEMQRMIEQPIIECSLHLSGVGVQVERLMGSNVIRLTDRKYMLELRQRLRDDFNDMLIKRIRNREADEMQRQRVLLMTGKLTNCSGGLKTNAIQSMHESPNKFLANRRKKLKTHRERMADRLVRKGKKWEADRLAYMEQERIREAENKIREMELLNTDQAHLSGGRFGKRNSRLKPRRSGGDTLAFWENERALMLKRMKPSDKQFKPFTKDLRIVDAKRRMSEASITSLKSIVAKVAMSMAKSAFQLRSQKTSKSEEFSSDDDLVEEKTDNSQSVQPIYVHPMINRLKQTRTVHDMYALAARIVGENIDNYMFDSTSGEIDESQVM